MARKILLINAHPDPSPERSPALAAAAYEAGVTCAGHDVRRIDLGTLDIPPVITGDELDVEAPAVIHDAQQAITWADHLTIAFPLWLGGPPSLLKRYFEQICRYDFAFDTRMTPLLTGRSARLIVTSVISEEVFKGGDGLGVEGFAWGVLRASGFDPIRTTQIPEMFTRDLGAHREVLEQLGAAGE